MKIEICGNKEYIKYVNFSINPVFSELFICSTKYYMKFSRNLNCPENSIGFNLQLSEIVAKVFLIGENEKDNEIFKNPFYYNGYYQEHKLIWITNNPYKNETIKVCSCHDWKKKTDSQFDNEKHVEVQCTNCGMVGDKNEETGEVYFPTT